MNRQGINDHPESLENWPQLHDSIPKPCHQSQVRGQTYHLYPLLCRPGSQNPMPWINVDFVMLKKLTPQEWAKCMRECRCFKCRKVGHNIKNYRTSSNKSQQSTLLGLLSGFSELRMLPQLLLPPRLWSHSLSLSMPTLGKTKEELLQT